MDGNPISTYFGSRRSVCANCGQPILAAAVFQPRLECLHSGQVGRWCEVEQAIVLLSSVVRGDSKVGHASACQPAGGSFASSHAQSAPHVEHDQRLDDTAAD